MFFKRKPVRRVTFYMNVRFSTDVLEHAYEQPVDAFLTKHGYGKMAGNGALFSSDDRSEVLEADFSVDLTLSNSEVISEIVTILEEAGAPLGCAWSFDDDPDVRTSFGTLDGLLIRFENLRPEQHVSFETFLHEVIDHFHTEHSDTAGFQGAVFSTTKALVSFHGFDFDDMQNWLKESMRHAGSRFNYKFERITQPPEAVGKKVT
ncbi:MAG: hypothetical protein AAF801_14800 [Pseudomonadota bacterium]